jgi:predicted TIM-barrel fold metal-dependent hydrolase
MEAGSKRYVVVSTDGHCGADVRDYKPYLESRYHDDFDAWADTYRDGWVETDQALDPDHRAGHLSYEAPLNWESRRRLGVLEDQGVAAEVLLPNTAPPFYPSSAVSAPGPRTPEEYEYRWAGLRAHNRWLVDFCSDAPGRRAGVAQLFLDDLEDTVAEIRWAREAGLKAVMLPGPHVLKMVNLYYPEYDAIWAVCQELDIPVCMHGVVAVEDPSVSGASGMLAHNFNINHFEQRQISHLIAAAVFDRFPTLKVAYTEPHGSSVIPGWLAGLDAKIATLSKHPGVYPWQDEAVRRLHRKPSEYFDSNVFLAGPLDLIDGIAAGAPNLMFGADLPHSEGTWPYTNEVLRLILPQLSEDEGDRLLSKRAAHVYGFDLDFLQGVADRIGPLAEQVRTALSTGDVPQWPEDTRCAMLASKSLARVGS